MTATSPSQAANHSTSSAPAPKELSPLATAVNFILPSRHLLNSHHFKADDSAKLTMAKIVLFIPRMWLEWAVVTFLFNLVLALSTVIMIVCLVPTLVVYYNQKCNKKIGVKKKYSWYIENFNLQKWLSTDAPAVLKAANAALNSFNQSTESK